MARPYSQDLRERLVWAVLSGQPRSSAESCWAFRPGSWIRHHGLNRWCDVGSLKAARPGPSGRSSSCDVGLG